MLRTPRLFVILLFLALFTLAARNVTDPDVWWHLRTGQLICETHSIPRTDPYSFTRFGQPWIDHEWLSQIVIYALYQIGSWTGLIIGFALVITAACVVLFLRCEGQPYVAGVMTAWGAIASVPCWGVRPQVFTILLTAVFLFLLERSDSRPNLLWWTLPLMVLWVNLHAGFAFGLALIGLFLCGNLLERTFGTRQDGSSLRKLFLALVLCTAVVPLNPYGFKLYRYPLETLHSKAMQAYIGEWFSPNFHEGRYLAALLMILATVIVPVFSPRRLKAREILLLVATTLMALRSVRHIPIYVLVAASILSAMVQAILQETGKARVFATAPSPVPILKVILNNCLLLAMLVFSGTRIRSVILGQAASEAREYPRAAAEYLETAGPHGQLLNHYNWGGYLIWKLYPTEKVFIDGRADVYGDAFLDSFASAYFLRGQAWNEPIQYWHIQTIVLPPDAPLIVALRCEPGWKAVFEDKQAVVLVKEK